MKQKTTANGEKKVFIRTTHAQSLPGQSSLGDTESYPSMPNAKTGQIVFKKDSVYLPILQNGLVAQKYCPVSL
jgi:hypothetical protein